MLLKTQAVLAVMFAVNMCLCIRACMFEMQATAAIHASCTLAWAIDLSPASSTAAACACHTQYACICYASYTQGGGGGRGGADLCVCLSLALFVCLYRVQGACTS